MPNNKKEFSDKDFNCKKCRARLALERFDRQCLIVGSAAFFNFARFACLNCEAVNSWEAPNLLPTNEEKLICRYPDKLLDVPKPEKRIINYLGVKGVSKAPGGKYRARIIIDGQTKYLGFFDSIAKASAAYEKAKSFAESR
jgi:ribosomal protein L40E